MFFLWSYQWAQTLTHFFCESSLSFPSEAHKKFCEELKKCLQSGEFLAYLSERKIKSLIQGKVVYFHSPSPAFFSAELVSLSSLYNVSRTSPTHPAWWKLNWHSDRKVRMVILLQSESIHSLLCSQSLHFHRQNFREGTERKKVAPAVAMKNQASLQERKYFQEGIFQRSKSFVGVSWFHCNGPRGSNLPGGLLLWVSLAGKQALQGGKQSLNSLILTHNSELCWFNKTFFCSCLNSHL